MQAVYRLHPPSQKRIPSIGIDESLDRPLSAPKREKQNRYPHS
jgi:hypothetical protein